MIKIKPFPIRCFCGTTAEMFGLLSRVPVLLYRSGPINSWVCGLRRWGSKHGGRLRRRNPKHSSRLRRRSTKHRLSRRSTKPGGRLGRHPVHGATAGCLLCRTIQTGRRRGSVNGRLLRSLKGGSSCHDWRSFTLWLVAAIGWRTENRLNSSCWQLFRGKLLLLLVYMLLIQLLLLLGKLLLIRLLTINRFGLFDGWNTGGGRNRNSTSTWKKRCILTLIE